MLGRQPKSLCVSSASSFFLLPRYRVDRLLSQIQKKKKEKKKKRKKKK
jgi:hypothetical protein